tara:strand:- start:321 stop:476 length:156 start_codon:yes stop_codon:yes gene_type:complete
MEWILALVVTIAVTYVVMMLAQYMVLKLIVWMKWHETDWFHDMIEEKKDNG